jgi:hypothetical protein
MSTSARSAAPLLLAASAAAAWGIGFAAAPAGAEPADSTTIGPTTGDSTVLPVTSVIEGILSEYVSPNAGLLPSPIGPVDQVIEQFVPTTTQVRDFFVFIQQFRPPAPITGPSVSR